MSEGQGSVMVEVLPWLGQALGREPSVRLTLAKEIDREMSLQELLGRLAGEDPAWRSLFDVESGRTPDYVSVVLNGDLVSPAALSERRVRGGDSVLLLPAFAGG